MRRFDPRRTRLFLLAALALSILLAASLGSAPLHPAATLRVLMHAAGLPVPPPPEEEQSIILLLRLPRVAAACLVGAALATAGCLLQGLLRNPLADPYVTGTSGGAALGAVLGMLLESRWPMPGLAPAGAFAGALGAILLVLRIATRGGRLPVVTGLLTGFVVGVLLGYTVSLLLVISERLQLSLPRVYSWLLGGLAVAGWEQVGLVALLVLPAVLLSLPLARGLNALSLGEDAAAALGVDVERQKRSVLLLSALLTAAAVSISGLIGFVGLVAPHAMRLLLGPDHRELLPASALAGALGLLLADLLARTLLAPQELPVGIITAMAGAPLFLWLLRRAPAHAA